MKFNDSRKIVTDSVNIIDGFTVWPRSQFEFNFISFFIIYQIHNIKYRYIINKLFILHYLFIDFDNDV